MQSVINLKACWAEVLGNWNFSKLVKDGILKVARDPANDIHYETSCEYLHDTNKER